MRDPKEWATELIQGYATDDEGRLDSNDIESLIREAQEDGAREWKRVAETRLGGVGANILREGFDFGERVTELEAQVAALTERAERAEEEANNYNELLVETCEKLDSAEYERDEAVKALDIHKERADRAESELHRSKF